MSEKLPNILVIDDQKVIRVNLIIGLRSIGYHNCFEADNGESAKNLLSSEHIDIIFCDINMPVSDGFDVLGHLGDIDFTGHIILMTGEEGEVADSILDTAKKFSLSLKGIVRKPLRIAGIKHILEKCSGTPCFVGQEQPHVLTASQVKSLLQVASVVPYFQPQICLETGEMVGVEVLARIVKQDNSIVCPYSFIPAAEQELDLILDITKRVITNAFEQICHNTTLSTELSVSLNISPVVLADDSFPKWLVEQCQLFGMHNERVTCELTETAALSTRPTVSVQMLRLRLLKFRLSIDDFGIGYSSIEQLHAIPFHELKLDKAFVMGCLENGKSAAIVEQSINMAKALGMTVVAEGVETAQIRDFLRVRGCDIAQGRFYSMPVPLSELPRRLATCCR